MDDDEVHIGFAVETTIEACQVDDAESSCQTICSGENESSSIVYRQQQTVPVDASVLSRKLRILSILVCMTTMGILTLCGLIAASKKQSSPLAISGSHVSTVSPSYQPSIRGMPSSAPSLQITMQNVTSSRSTPPSFAPSFWPNEELLARDANEDASPKGIESCPIFDPPPPLPGKKGLGIGRKKDYSSKALRDLGVYWSYRWGPVAHEDDPEHIKFLPMLFGSNRKKGLGRYIVDSVESGETDLVLGYNEPDLKTQGNMNVTEALDFWAKLEALNVSLVSPSAQHPLGDWMQEFMDSIEKECRRVDWIGVHWYGPPNASLFKTKMKEIHRRYGQRPLLITGFAPADWSAFEKGPTSFSQGDVLDFMKKVLPWLEREIWIAGYSWFPFTYDYPQGRQSAMFTEDFNETAIFKYYASVTTDRPKGDLTIMPDS